MCVGGGGDTWLHGHVRCVPVCVMMFEGEGVMGTYIRMYLCGGGEELGSDTCKC